MKKHTIILNQGTYRVVILLDFFFSTDYNLFLYDVGIGSHNHNLDIIQALDCPLCIKIPQRCNYLMATTFSDKSDSLNIADLEH